MENTYIKTEINEVYLQTIMDGARMMNCAVMAFIVGTKPCFNKIYGTIREYKKRGLPFFVINANQHYDSELIYMMKEFHIDTFTAVNLHIKGDLAQKSQDLFTKTVEFARYTKNKWPNVSIVPVLLGDTILCPIVSSAWMLTTGQKCIHLEAGLRSMKPTFFNDLDLTISLDDYIHKQRFGDWEIARDEPYPEQWCTFTTSAACDYHIVPLSINKENLLREGYEKSSIIEVGGLITDAIYKMEEEGKTNSVFDTYSRLKNGSWIRIDIHRRENLTEERIHIILKAIETLADNNFNINLILLNSFKEAITKYNLVTRLKAISEKKNVLTTEVWPSYAQVYEFYKSNHFLCAITDSGGVQEDMNIIGKPCITIRNSTDRPETIQYPNELGNILVPPIDASFMVRIINEILMDKNLLEDMANVPNIYGADVGEKVAETLESIARPVN